MSAHWASVERSRHHSNAAHQHSREHSGSHPRVSRIQGKTPEKHASLCRGTARRYQRGSPLHHELYVGELSGVNRLLRTCLHSSRVTSCYTTSVNHDNLHSVVS